MDYNLTENLLQKRSLEKKGLLGDSNPCLPDTSYYPLTWPKKPEAGCKANFFRELILPIKMNPLKEEMLFWCYILFSNYYIIVSGVRSEVVWHVLMLQGN